MDRPALEDEIEVTPEMIEAGCEVMSRWSPDDRQDWLVATLFRAMLKASCADLLASQVSSAFESQKRC